MNTAKIRISNTTGEEYLFHSNHNPKIQGLELEGVGSFIGLLTRVRTLIIKDILIKCNNVQQINTVIDFKIYDKCTKEYNVMYLPIWDFAQTTDGEVIEIRNMHQIFKVMDVISLTIKPHSEISLEFIFTAPVKSK